MNVRDDMGLNPIKDGDIYLTDNGRRLRHKIRIVVQVSEQRMGSMSNIFQSDPDELAARIANVQPTKYNHLLTDEECDAVIAEEEERLRQRRLINKIRRGLSKTNTTFGPESGYREQ